VVLREKDDIEMEREVTSNALWLLDKKMFWTEEADEQAAQSAEQKIRADSSIGCQCASLEWLTGDGPARTCLMDAFDQMSHWLEDDLGKFRRTIERADELEVRTLLMASLSVSNRSLQASGSSVLSNSKPLSTGTPPVGE
jgi:hypothetical protein